MQTKETTNNRYIAYYRVSTLKQGLSGLGLEAQKAAVDRFINNCPDCVIESYTDVVSGRKNKRPELLKAIEASKEHGAKLLIAKLDRLSRNAQFIFALRDSGVDFVCCDMPDANTLTIGMFATLAQYEAELISARTKAALKAYKKRMQAEDPNFKLGSPKGWDKDILDKVIEKRKKEAKKNQNTIMAKKAIKDLINLRLALKESLTIREVAEHLKGYGIKTPKGKNFTPHNVRHVLDQVLLEMGLKRLKKFKKQKVKK